MPGLAALLPPEAPPQARPFSLGGLQGQQARATVYIEEVLLSQVQDGLLSRPKSAAYYATYRCAIVLYDTNLSKLTLATEFAENDG